MIITLLSLFACDTTSAWDESATGTSTVATGKSALYAVNPELGTVGRVDRDSHELSELTVGNWPTRVAVDGDRVFVTLRANKQLLVLHDDGEQLVEHDTITLDAEPVGVLVGNAAIYVATGMADTVFELDADSFEVLRTFPVAGQPQWLALNGDTLYVAGAVDASLTAIDLRDGTAVDFSLENRVEDDANHTRGSVELIPRITGDISMSPDGKELAIPVLWVDPVTEVVELEDTGFTVEPSGYAGGASTRHEDITRFNPSVVIVDVQGGEPNDSTTFSVAHGSRSYPSSVTWTPDSAGVYVTQESAGLVVALSRTGSARVMSANRGARGIAWVDGEPVSHGFLDHDLSWIGQDSPTTVSITNEALPDDVAAGQILFYSSGGVMSADGSGLSCSTCHFEGRNDGQTWMLHNGPRQTMTLAGKISGTEPISWTNGVPSVQHEAQATSETRMGGSGLHDRDADRIAAFIDFTPNPDLPAQDAQSVLRGKEIFERADVGCADCHNGSSYTDNQVHTMFGLEDVNTPTLTGIASTAPYLHDGRYKTLGALLDSLAGEMGDTSMLTDQEMADLEAYLRSL